MPAIDTSIPALLEYRAQHQPDENAYTFLDYDVDPAGFSESLTWTEVRHRVQVVADKLAKISSPGDRAVVLAPQGLDYIVGFLGAVEAGLIAVPLSVPNGRHDERVIGAFADSTPVAVLTTSAIADGVRGFLQDQGGARQARVIEVDTLDFDTSANSRPAPSIPASKVAYLQYTSGSTRRPAGVSMTHKNVSANLHQAVNELFESFDPVPPPGTTVVSWAPFYHDMGMLIGICAPLVHGFHAVLMSPVAFLQKPSRWIAQLALNSGAFTAAPNFAFDLAAARTTDEDLAGLDLSDVRVVINGAERVLPSTVRRFNQRFAANGLPEWAMRQVWGMAEATVFGVSSPGGQPMTITRFSAEGLSAGHAELCADGGSELVGAGTPRTSDLRIVDPESMVEKPAGEVGEIWLRGDQVAAGYWHNPELTAEMFGGQLAEGTPRGPWLRTGDYGVMFDGQLYVIGRMKDLLIVDGRNIYPDDVETTVSGVTGGRVAAVSIPGETGERLVVVAEVKNGDPGLIEAAKTSVTAAVSRDHGVRIADLVLVGARSLPVTTSGKIRRAASAELYRRGEFTRLDVH